MTESVILYQLSILLSVIGIGIVIGEKTMLGTAVAWAIWTSVMVFTRWLYVMQFLTIFAAIAVGFEIQDSARYRSIQSFLRKTLLGIGILLVIGVGAIIYIEMKPQGDRAATVEGPSRDGLPPITIPRSTPFDDLGQRKQGLNSNPEFDNATAPSVAERAPQPETKIIYRCVAKLDGQTHITYQDFPCKSNRQK